MIPHLVEAKNALTEARLSKLVFADGTKIEIEAPDALEILLGIPFQQRTKMMTGTEPVPQDRERKLLKKAKKVSRPEKPTKPRKETTPRELPTLDSLADKVSLAMVSSLKGHGSDVIEYVMMMPRTDPLDSFENYLANVSADVAMNWEYALAGKAEQEWLKLLKAHKEGRYTSFRASPDLREIKSRLAMAYSEAWHEVMVQAWRKLQKNSKKMAEIEARRQR
jgi:hypothetical protein